MNKKLLISFIAIIILVLAGSLLPKNNERGDVLVEESGVEEQIIVTDEVEYFAGTTGYFARPKIDGTYPGLILIHEWWGLNNNSRICCSCG